MFKKYHLTAPLVAIALLASTSIAFAAETLVITAHGMVCDFCAQAVAEYMGSEDSVKNVTVDLDAKTITIVLNDGFEVSDELATKWVEDSGYDVAGIDRMTTEHDTPASPKAVSE